MTRIPPGTVVRKQDTEGWNRLILLAIPRLASGDVNRIPGLARSYAAKFSPVLMANVLAEERGSGVQYRLQKVGVGLCARVDGSYVVVSSETKGGGAVDLDMISNHILATGEQCLKDIIQVARLDTLAIVDAKAIFLRDGQHRDVVVRHLVWMDAGDGQIGTLVWLLQEDGQGGYRMGRDPVRALPGGFVEDRVVNIRSNEFVLGVPTSRAFALVRLPQGKPIEVGSEFENLATARRYDAERLRSFVRVANAALRSARETSVSESR